MNNSKEHLYDSKYEERFVLTPQSVRGEGENIDKNTQPKEKVLNDGTRYMQLKPRLLTFVSMNGERSGNYKFSNPSFDQNIDNSYQNG
jgi:hypothetical protein